MTRPRIHAVAILMLAWLSGCTGPQWYGTGQAWQRHQCEKIPDPLERARCVSSTATSYEAYQREAEAAKRGD